MVGHWKSMEKLHPKGLSYLFVLFILSLLLISPLSSSESPRSPTKPAGIRSPQVSAEDKPKPERLPKLIVAQESDTSTMDAHYVTDSVSASVMDHMVETLLELTPKGEIAPKLAEKWEVSSDATEFTLKLKKGIRFHDGQPLNAEAVKVNFDRRLDPKGTTKFYFLVAPISSVTVVDEYTLKIRTKMPFAPLLGNLTCTANGVQSPAALNKSWDKPLTMPIGTGPFIFKEWVKGNKVVMVRNDNYWGKKPHVSEVTFRAIPDDASRVVAVETGEVHVAVRIPPSDVPLLKEKARITILNMPSVRTIYIGFNCLKKPYTDKRVRQALNYAVNKGAIVKHVLGGTGRVSDAPISPGIFGYTRIKTYEHNIEKAKALLAEAGFPEGFETELYYSAGRYSMDSSVVKAVTDDLLKVGVKVDIKTMGWETYVSHILQENEVADHELFMLGWGCLTGDADYGLYTLFHSGEWPKKGLNASFFKNEKLDQLLDAARSMANPGKRKALYEEAMTIVMDEAPWLFLHSEIQLVGVRSNVKDIRVHPTERVIAKEARIE